MWTSSLYKSLLSPDYTIKNVKVVWERVDSINLNKDFLVFENHAYLMVKNNEPLSSKTMENKEAESRVFDSITISITLGTVEGVSMYKYSFSI